MMKNVCLLSMPSLLVLAACNPAPENVEAIATNDLDNAIAVEDDADSRAARLDEAATALDADADRIGGALGNRIRNSADTDISEAAAVRASGDNQAAQIEYTGDQAIDAVNNRNAAASRRP